MRKDFYVGDDAPLSFKVFVNEKPSSPLSAKGYLFNNKSELIFEDNCEIDGSNVRFMVKGKYNSDPGIYTAMFAVIVRKYGKKNYPLKYNVHPLPVKKAIREKMEKKASRQRQPELFI